MAVGKGSAGPLLPVAGVTVGVARAGIKKPERRDLVVLQLAEGSEVAGVFTTNAFQAAPVRVAREHLANTAARALVINTGNANAGTGERGLADARATCAELAALLDVTPEAVLPFSTGVIGEYLPMQALRAGLPEAVADLAPEHWAQAAEGILTTDTRTKAASRRIELDGEAVTLTGIAKGSGMICPNMATMLAFVATDARLDPALLDEMLRDANERSFNRITVDSDTSTNDACMLIATGRSGAPQITAGPHREAFMQALTELMIELAQGVIRDGEGATKFVEIAVEQAASTAEALAVAYTIAHSPLVKTALTASDANWGRILAAVGRSGLADLDLGRVEIWLDEVCIVAGGERAPGYTEAAGSAVVAREELTIRVRLGRGEVADRVWTTDLSHEYISINADYRT